MKEIQNVFQIVVPVQTQVVKIKCKTFTKIPKNRIVINYSIVGNITLMHLKCQSNLHRKKYVDISIKTLPGFKATPDDDAAADVDVSVVPCSEGATALERLSDVLASLSSSTMTTV